MNKAHITKAFGAGRLLQIFGAGRLIDSKTLHCLVNENSDSSSALRRHVGIGAVVRTSKDHCRLLAFRRQVEQFLKVAVSTASLYSALTKCGSTEHQN